MPSDEQNSPSKGFECNKCSLTFQTLQEASRHRIEAHRTKAVKDYFETLSKEMKRRRGEIVWEDITLEVHYNTRHS